MCCSVVNSHCDAPANLWPVRKPRSRCEVCGERVCTNRYCSRRLTDAWLVARIPDLSRSASRIRVCESCFAEAPERFPGMTLERWWRPHPTPIPAGAIRG